MKRNILQNKSQASVRVEQTIQIKELVETLLQYFHEKLVGGVVVGGRSTPPHILTHPKRI